MSELGYVFGVMHANKLNAADFERERARLCQALVDEEANRLSEIAQTEAVALCIGAVVGELKKSEAGIPFERRHSDPDARAVRGEDFLDTAEEELRRLSSGRLSFSDRDIRSIKGAGMDVKRIVNSDHMKPRRKAS